MSCIFIIFREEKQKDCNNFYKQSYFNLYAYCNVKYRKRGQKRGQKKRLKVICGLNLERFTLKYILQHIKIHRKLVEISMATILLISYDRLPTRYATNYLLRIFRSILAVLRRYFRFRGKTLTDFR